MKVISKINTNEKIGNKPEHDLWLIFTRPFFVSTDHCLRRNWKISEKKILNNAPALLASHNLIDSKQTADD